MERKYIVTERTDLFEPNVYISFVVEFEKKIEPQMLMDAVNQAFLANETTMSRIVLLKGGKAYYEKMKKSGCKVSCTAMNFEKLIEENEKKPFALKDGECMRVFVSETGKEILLMAHHQVGDGMSLVLFLKDVLRALSKEKLVYKEADIFTKEKLQKYARLPLGVKAYITHINRKWKKEEQIYTWQDYDAVHETYWSRHKSKMIYHTFDEKETKEIIEKAKTAKVTLNNYLISMLLQKQQELDIIGIPVTVREGNTMANQVSAIAIKYRYLKRKSNAKNAVRIQKRVQKLVKNPNKKYFVLLFLAELKDTLMDAAVLAAHGKEKGMIARKLSLVMGYLGKKKRDLGVTNLGVLDFSEIGGDYGIQNLIFLPPAVSYTKHVVGVSTVNGCLTLSYHGMEEK